MAASEALVAVIVMSVGPRDSLVAAVQSVLAQDEPVELVVVHSGPGDPRPMLEAAGIAARVVVSEQPLLPGGARNLGIAATSAPWVAFLADDCEACPAWVRLRREAHESGHDAVASALLCHRPMRPVSLAAHLSLFVNRMPRTRPGWALRYGVSYSRAVFAQRGRFREDMRGGEDTEFNARLGPPEAIHWDPSIRTIHRGTESLAEFLCDQAQRGRRMVDARIALGDGMEGRVVRDAVVRISHTLRRSVRLVDRRQLPVLVVAAPIIAAGGLAYAWGASRQGRRA